MNTAPRIEGALARTLDWRRRQVLSSDQRCTSIPLRGMEAWELRDGSLSHRSRGFFSISGVRVHSSLEDLDGREQPIIVQPEVGILGFLMRRRAGRSELLVQAKAEPGNVGAVQLAPTVQATESNYRRLHGGAATFYLAYFLDGGRGTAVADVLQSEQGTRFLGKFNRNVIVQVRGSGPEPVSETWRWCDASIVLALCGHDYTVNTDARSVLVCGDWAALAPEAGPFERWRTRGGFGEDLLRSYEASEDASELRDAAVLSFLDRRAGAVRLRRRRLPLSALTGWRLDDDLLIDRRESAFAVRGFRVRVRTREVPAWDQPLIHSMGEGESTLVCQRRRGILHFLLRASPEIGFRRGVELGPTVGSPGAGGDRLHELAAEGREHASCMQSDEGGRFFRSVARYRVVEIGEGVEAPAGSPVCPVTLRQLHRLLRQPGQLTNELRSALSLLLSYL